MAIGRDALNGAVIAGAELDNIGNRAAGEPAHKGIHTIHSKEHHTEPGHTLHATWCMAAQGAAQGADVEAVCKVALHNINAALSEHHKEGVVTIERRDATAITAKLKALQRAELLNAARCRVKQGERVLHPTVKKEALPKHAAEPCTGCREGTAGGERCRFSEVSRSYRVKVKLINIVSDEPGKVKRGITDYCAVLAIVGGPVHLACNGARCTRCKLKGDCIPEALAVCVIGYIKACALDA